MSSLLAPMTRSKAAGLGLAAAAVTLAVCGAAAAQTFQNPKAQSAYAQWRQLSQSEVDCVDRALQSRRTSLWATIQQGVGPTDSNVAALRAGCRAQAQATAAPRRTDDTAAERAAAERAAAEKAAAERAERAAAAKAAADKAAAEKAAAQKAQTEKAQAEKAATERASAEKAAADKAAAEKAAAEKDTAEKAAAEKNATEAAAEDKTPARHTSALELAANQAALEMPPLTAAAAAPEAAKTERYKIASVSTPAEQRREVRYMSEAVMAYTAAESRMSFIYGLITGPIIFSCGGVMVLLLGRRRNSRMARDAVAGTGSTFHRS